VLHRKCALRPREKARCTRCGAILYRGTSSDLARVVALILGAALVFLIAQCSPIVEITYSGIRSSATLMGAIRVLWSEQMRVVATLVFLFTVLFPAVELGALLYVSLGLRAGFKVPGFDLLLRAVRAARRWGMIEVLMIGILVTLIKMTAVARVAPQPGLFAFAVLTMMLAVVIAIDPKALWNIGDDLAPQAPPRLDYAALLASGVELLPCHACGLVTPFAPGAPGLRRRCARCGGVLHHRHPDSVNRTWALLLSAALLYLPANVLPVMYTRSLLGVQEDTIMSGVVYFWESGSRALAVIVFTASIVVPLLKLAVLALLAATAQRRSSWRPLQRTRLYRLIEFIGRWSMLDIFVVTLTVALVRFDAAGEITPGPGAFAFGLVVVLTMLASMQFDPRLIWDHPSPLGEKHA